MVLAAGVAQADVSFSGTAGVALIDDNGASDATRVDMFFESYYDFDITASAESDNGVSVSVGFDMGAGNKIDYNDDDVLEAQGNTVGDADVAVSYNGWTLTVDQAGIDNLFDDTDGAQDVSIAGSIAGWSVAMTSDQEGSTSSYKVGGNVAGVALTFTGTDNDDAGGSATGISASYAMGDLTVSAAMSDESNDAEDDTSVGFSYAMDALTVGYTTIKPGSAGLSATSGTLLLNTQRAQWLHLSLLTKQTRLQSLLITHSVAAHLLSQQCTTNPIQLVT